MDFCGKTVVVTGAGAGMGRGSALEFARLGGNVVVNSRSEHNSKSAADEITSLYNKAIYVAGDVSEESVAKELIERAVSEFGSVDVVVNCAGVVPQGTVLDASPEEWDEVMKTNVKSVYLVSRYAIEQMRKQGTGGSIITIASAAAIKGYTNRALYSASKGAVCALTRAMAQDHIKENIRINCISPGTVLTPSLEDRINSESDPQAALERYVSRQPMGRLGTPEEMASVIAFIASDDNRFMTGANIVADGGVSL